jgi:hypothetical protein
VPENVERWWARRQWSKGERTPYVVGEFRADWERYPVLIRQYHPDLNGGIALTQVPPAADVYLQWQCDAGHIFVATPLEQRNRPTGTRRRSTWCPECSVGALGHAPRKRRTVMRPPAPGRPGDSLISPHAPRVASAAEALLRQKLGERLEIDLSPNAVRVTRPFHGRTEVWPDIVIDELRVAIEYDTTGRDGLEHVGPREESDLSKDRLLRQVGWEVIRVRTGKLLPLGPYDVGGSGVTAKLVEAVIERLREIRGDLIVDSYLRRAPGALSTP